MFMPRRTAQVMSGRRSPRPLMAGVRWALVGATLGLMLAGCGDKKKTVTKETTASPTQAQTTTPAPTASVIEVQRGIGSATLGMSEVQVRQSLGAPLRADQVRNNTGPYTEFTYPDRLTVAFQRGGSFSGGASSFFVKGTGARTPEGIGVGSTEADVDARVAGATCEVVSGQRTCHVGAYKPGATITEFQIDGGRVTHVRVARVSN
jgi:hypothetical protein